MIKNLILVVFLSSGLFYNNVFACKSCGCSTKKESHSHSKNSITKEIDTLKSSVKWIGKKITGSHEGIISIKDSHLHFENESLTGGTVKIDMQTIKCTDLTGDAKAQLESHLLSDDFFGTKFYPTAELEILKSIKVSDGNYNINGIITIKGIKKDINFNSKIDKNRATATIKIDRSEFNIKYGSGSFFDDLGDNLIYDDFDLVIDIAFK